MIAILVALLAVGCAGPRTPADGDRFAAAREAMVREQIEARGIRDPLTLAALRKVERHLFVPEAFAARAYADHPLPIGHEQTISQPYIVAFMTEAARLRGGETVLEIGTGSGYQAAVLAAIAAKVYSIEIVEPLAASSRERLRRLGYDNVEVRAGDGYAGWAEAAPFDAILITAAAPRVPPALKAQLKDGGRLVMPLGDEDQRLVVITRTGARYAETRLLPVRFVPMTGEIRR